MVSDTPPTLSAVLPTRGQVPGEEKRGFPPRAFASQDSLIPLGEGYSACPLFFLWLVLHPQHVRARYPYNTKQTISPNHPFANQFCDRVSWTPSYAVPPIPTIFKPPGILSLNGMQEKDKQQKFTPPWEVASYAKDSTPTLLLGIIC